MRIKFEVENEDSKWEENEVKTSELSLKMECRVKMGMKFKVRIK